MIQGNGVLPFGTDTAIAAKQQPSGIVVTTNAQGEAAVPFQLGQRSGTGNHRVRASAVGFPHAYFHASATQVPVNYWASSTATTNALPSVNPYPNPSPLR